MALKDRREKILSKGDCLAHRDKMVGEMGSEYLEEALDLRNNISLAWAQL